tara:strand:- start:918 stop:1706 length:789 start_codon:yes stop_codon:yes gene_type:complete
MKETINLVSFPRSGNTWTRYLLENLTGYHSSGTGDLNKLDGDRFSIFKDMTLHSSHYSPDKKGIILKWHDYVDLLSANTVWGDSWHADWTSDRHDNKTILLVRHPVEAEETRKRRKINKSRPVTAHPGPLPEYYFTNILHFLNCQENDTANKHMSLLYREVFQYPDMALRKMSNFVNNPQLDIDKFMHNINDHRATSIAKYKNQLRQKPMSEGTKSVTPYSDTLSPGNFDKKWYSSLWRAKEIDIRVHDFLVNAYGQNGRKV